MTDKNSGKKASIKPKETPKKELVINKDEDQVELESGDEEDNYEDDDQQDEEPKGLGLSPA